jgi:hypothetical protein
MSAVVDLRHLLGRLRLQLGFECLAAAAIRGAIAGALALVALAIGIWFVRGDETRLWLAGAPVLAAVVLALVRWPSPRETALAADRRLGLEERLSTALELMRGSHYGRFVELQLRDTIGHTASVQRTWLLLDTRTRNEALVALAAIALATSVALLLPGVPRPVASPPTEIAAATVDVATQDDLGQRLVPLDTADQSVGANAQPQASTAPQPDLANRVQQDAAERSALDSLAQALGNVSAGQPAADAIQQGDFAGARDQLQNLADNADQLSDAAKQQLGRGLQQAAAATTQTDRALADREQQAAQALTRSTYTDQRQTLRALADQVQRSGSRSVSSDQLQREVGQLQQQSASAQASGAAQPGAQPGPGQADGAAASGQAPDGSGQQTGAGVGTASDPDVLADHQSRLDTAGQEVQVPTRLGKGPGVRPPNGTEDQSTPDPGLGGRSVAELAQAQQTGQVTPEQNLVPGEQRPVVRGYFR